MHRGSDVKRSVQRFQLALRLSTDCFATLLPFRFDLRLLSPPFPPPIWTFFPGLPCTSFPFSSVRLCRNSLPLAFSLDGAPCVHRALPEARKWGGREDGPVGVSSWGCAHGRFRVLSRAQGGRLSSSCGSPRSDPESRGLYQLISSGEGQDQDCLRVWLVRAGYRKRASTAVAHTRTPRNEGSVMLTVEVPCTGVRPLHAAC